MIPIILAAGESRRFGVQKLNYPYKGKPLIQWTINVVEENFSNGFLIVSEKLDLSKISVKKLEIILNKNPDLGLSNSIKLGLTAANGRDVIIFLGDMPEIDSQLVQKVVSLSKDKIVFPNFNGIKGFPVFIPSNYFKSAYEIEGDRGLRDLIMKSEYLTFEWTRSCVFDVDLPEDLEGAGEDG
ncbi:nucleotidyltransferase family protein [Athalassotoga saccharophila]|uniref:nucleotidyltransferase family protein n=1 Tax=Athalassotoga saccharophila TaxID=1441386 RepID=UPI00137B4CCF|nr:nucleotidyltransferase family protein [Athalassotoga saccharophila]BBJ28875.1 molybdenum cofactor cytidylyltransferase [Athalassotoga saccharophila]